MATPNHTEYIAIDGLPLSTAAWSTEDIATLLNGPSVRGSDLVLPGRSGQLARRRTLDSRQITIPVVVNGFYDSDGIAHADPRSGLVANLDELKAHLAPRYTTLDGTRTLVWDNGNDIYRSADVHLSPDLQVASIGPHAARVVITATIPSGVLRDAGGESYVRTQVASGTDTLTFTASVPGTGEVQDASVYVGGLATWSGPDPLTTGSGAPTPGSGATGDWYFDLDDADTPLYGPRDAGGDWPGPFSTQYGGSAPADDNISREDYWVVISGGPSEVYYGRTIANPQAASFKLENLTYDPSGGVYVRFDSTVDALLVIECGDYYAHKGGTEVSGNIVIAGTPLWLPLQPGDNTLRLVLTSNTADSAINVLYRAVYL